MLSRDLCKLVHSQEGISRGPLKCYIQNMVWGAATKNWPLHFLWIRLPGRSLHYVIHILKYYRKSGLISTEGETKNKSNKSIATILSHPGNIDKGGSYLIYQFILFCDKFDQISNLFLQGRVAGNGMMQLGLSFRQKRSVSYIGIMSFMQVGVSTTNQLFD